MPNDLTIGACITVSKLVDSSVFQGPQTSRRFSWHSEIINAIAFTQAQILSNNPSTRLSDLTDKPELAYL